MDVSKTDQAILSKVKYELRYNPKQIRMPHNVPLILVSDLVPYENNVKIHTPEQIAKICASIDTDGLWTNPVIVDGDNVLIAGHGRRLAALHYGLRQVPCIRLEDVSKETANAIRIADNKVAEGGIDTALLEEELRLLADFGIDMIGIFDERELDFMLDDLGEINLDEIADDISEEVNRKAEETKDIVDRVKTGLVAIKDIFGTSTISADDARALKLFILHLEESIGGEGIEALITHAKQELASQ